MDTCNQCGLFDKAHPPDGRCPDQPDTSIAGLHRLKSLCTEAANTGSAHFNRDDGALLRMLLKKHGVTF